MAITYTEHALLTGLDIHTGVTWEVVDATARLALVVTVNDKDKIAHQTDNHTYWIMADTTGPTWVELTAAGAAAVTTIFARTGDVVAAAGDYTASEITSVAAGNLAATDVQTALNELDTEKAAATHTHVLSQITDSGTAAAADTGIAVGDIPLLEDIGGGVPGLPAVDGSQLTGLVATGSAITVTDEGGAPLTADVQSFDFVGTGVTASSVGDDVTITIAAGSAPIDTVFARTGTITADAGDYTAAKITNTPAGDVAAITVQAAIDELDTDKAATGDTRFPTADEKGALAGTGIPSGSNLYVTADTLAAKTHTLSEIDDSGTAAGKNTGVGNDDVPLLAQGPYTTDGTLTLDDGAGNTINVMGWGIYPGATNPDYFEFGGEIQTTPRITYFSGTRSNADATKAGQVVIRGGVADGTNSAGGDIEIYGGIGASGGGDLRLGGWDNAGTDVPLSGDVRMLKGFTVAESASAPYTTVAGRGQLWPRSSDGAIMWTDSSDVEHDLTTGGGSNVEIEYPELTSLTTAVTKISFDGGGVSVTEPTPNEVLVTVAGGSAPVASWGPIGSPRTGVINPIASDYNASQVDNDAANAQGNVTGAFVSSALDTADVAIEANTTAAAAAQADADSAQSDATAAKAKTDFLTVTGAVNLDTVLSNTNTNNAKRSYPVADEAMVDDHEATLANVATPITAVGAALLDDATVIEQRGTLGLKTAAVYDVGVGIGDLVELVNVGGNPGFPTLRGDNLVGVSADANISVVDADTGPTTLTTNVQKFTFTGAGVALSEPTADEITVTITGGGGGAIDITDGTTTVSAADKLTFDGTAFDVVDETANDALVNPIFGASAGQIAEGNHTHDTLANIDNTAGNGVILGRDTAGVGLSEELTPAEARAVIDVTLQNIGAGTHSQLELASVDSGAIFASLQTGQVETLTDVAAATGQKIPIELTGVSGAWRRVDMDDLLANDLEATATNAADNEVFVGTGANAGTYIALPTTGAVSFNGTAFAQAALADLSDVTTPTGTGEPVLATSPTIVTPTIASMTNAQHDHADAAGGGTIAYANITGTPTIPSVPTHTKSITIPAPVSGEIWDMWAPPEAITVTGIAYWCRGTTPSVPFNVAHGTNPTSLADIDSTGWTATNTTSIIVDTTFAGGDLLVAANETIAVDITGAVTGTDPVLHVDVRYTVD